MSQQGSLSEIELVIERLELRGHRVTSSRRRVLDAVLSQTGHFTVDDILRSTRKVGRATVFRTMKILQDLNIVCRVLLDDGTLHYRLSTGRHHHHLVCTNCGRVEDFSNCDVNALVRDLQTATQYEIEGHWLEVYGRCQACRVLRAEGTAISRKAPIG
jgi:Fur family ferric uptake transcriptional regulator